MIRPALALAALTLTAAAVTPVLLDFDFENLPPTSGEVNAQLVANGASLAAQVSAAEKAAAGKATIAEMDTVTGVATVTVYGAQKASVVTVGKDGVVTDTVEKGRFPGESVTGDWTETASGLKYYDIVIGDGATPPDPSTKVRVHYSGWTLDGKQFDSSYKRNQPADFALNRVIKGWTEGVGSMKVGGKRKLILPFQLGYGAGGNPRAGIPPRATLVFDVELLEIMN